LWEISATILITTLRIGDAMSLTEKDLILTKDIVYLRKKNEKTGVYSEMPLPKFLSDIYRENLTRHGRIYSIQPDREVVYKGMKDFFRMYDDLHEIVSVADVDVRGKEFIVSKPLWEWVHPHLLRKTAITTMIYNKVPERFIKFASGHSTNSTAFERYVGHVEKYYKSEINDYYGKMFN
jgi:integrase